MIVKIIITACVLHLCILTAFAQSPVTITVGAKTDGKVIPADFVGESFETASIRINNNHVKGYMFDASTTQMVNLFRSLGIKNLRIGGGTVDNKSVNPTRKDIDALFRFAEAADAKIVYSFRLLNGNAEENAATAKYIWTNHRRYLDCFAIGNEPDWHSFHLQDTEIVESTPGIPGSAYPSYIAKWKRFSKAILDSVPGAKFCGPNSGSNFPVTGAKNTGWNGKSWTANFLDDEKKSGILAYVTQHNYVGQSTGDKTAPVVIEKLLSPEWNLVQYPALYASAGVPAVQAGFPFRLMESNSFSEGIDGASNVFATSLFALDYLHWWAQHGAAGVNYHSTQWRVNATVRFDADSNFQINPMGYGIAAFTAGSHGRTTPVTISNPENVNLTAYAVRNADTLYVTIINREHGTIVREATVTIQTSKRASGAVVMYLSAPNGDVMSKTNVTLGGAAITSDKPWTETWTPLPPSRGNTVQVKIPSASAGIVKIITR
jgi:hypothetical protein